MAYFFLPWGRELLGFLFPGEERQLEIHHKVKNLFIQALQKHVKIRFTARGSLSLFPSAIQEG